MSSAYDAVLDEIKSMGFVLPTRYEGTPSCYRLKDGAILVLLHHVYSLVPSPKPPNDFSINAQTVSLVYTKEKYPEKFRPLTQSQIRGMVISEDMEPATLLEEFTDYALTDGKKLSVKIVVGQVAKTGAYNLDGSPIYLINSLPVIKVKTKPDSLK